jgi:hypothetical protein
MKTYGGSGGIALPFLTLAIDGGEWSASRPDRFTPRERAPGIHWIGDWVGPRASLAAVEKKKKSLAPTGNWTPAVQPVAIRHTDKAIPAPLENIGSFNVKWAQLAHERAQKQIFVLTGGGELLPNSSLVS